MATAKRRRQSVAERPTALEVTAAQGMIARFDGFEHLAAAVYLAGEPPCLARSELILTPGLRALVGLLLQPSLDGFSAVPHVAAHPISDWTVTPVPPAIQSVNGDAQHFRNIRE